MEELIQLKAEEIIEEVFDDVVEIEKVTEDDVFITVDNKAILCIGLENEIIDENRVLQIAKLCEYIYNKHNVDVVQSYVLVKDCILAANEFTIPSEAAFSIKMALEK